MKGVQTRVRQSMLALLSNSKLTMLVRPHLLETCSGLIPFYNTHTQTYNQSINGISIAPATKHVQWCLTM